MLGPTEPLGDVGPTTQNPCHSQGCVGPSCADPRYLNAPLVLPRKTHRALRVAQDRGAARADCGQLVGLLHQGVRGEEVPRHAQGHHERPRARVSERVLCAGGRYAASGYVPRGGVSTRASVCTVCELLYVRVTCTLRDSGVARVSETPSAFWAFGIGSCARVAFRNII